MREQPIPFHEAQNEHINMRNLSLPPYLRDSVGVNLQKTQQLMGMGGIGSLYIENFVSDAQDDTPRLVGMNRDGSAIASVARSLHKSENKTAGKLSDSTTIPGISELWDPGNKTTQELHLDIKLDIESIGQRLSESREVASGNAWSKELNSAIKGVVMREGVSYMVKPMSLTGSGMDVLIATAAYLADDVQFISLLASLDLGIHTLHHIYNVRRNLPSRMSAFYDFSVDRAAIMYAMGATSHRKLIAPTKV